MRYTFGVAAVVAAFGCGWAVCAAVSQDKKVVFIDSSKAEYKPAPVPGASMAWTFGDPAKGRCANFTKFEPGAKFAMHSHTSDMRIIVLKGAYVRWNEKGEEEMRVGPGGYLFSPGGEHHISGGDAKEGALFYMEADGPFDIIPDKK